MYVYQKSSTILPVFVFWNVDFIIEGSGHLIQSSNNFFRITAAGPPEVISQGAYMPESAHIESGDECSISSISEEDIDLSGKAFDDITSTNFRKKNDDDAPPPHSGQHMYSFFLMQQNASCYQLMKPTLKSDSEQTSGFHDNFENRHSVFRFNSPIAIFLLLESLKKIF